MRSLRRFSCVRASRHADNLPRPQKQVICLRCWRRPPDVIVQLGNHLVQRLDLFIGDSGLGGPHQLEHGLWVDDGKRAARSPRPSAVSKAPRAACFRTGRACTEWLNYTAWARTKEPRWRLVRLREIRWPRQFPSYPLPEQIFLFPQRLIERFNSLPQNGPLATGVCVTRNLSLSLRGSWSGGLLPRFPAPYRLGLPFSLLRCPIACGHQFDPLIVCFAGFGFLPRACVQLLHWPTHC